MNESKMRKDLTELLRAGHAHVTLFDALEGFNPKNRSIRPAKDLHSVWELLEHMRISQEDILRYTLDASWKSPEWPEGYWPAKNSISSAELWDKSVAQFNSDLEELIAIVNDKSIDLTAEIPHGEGRTYLREIMLAADHNSYHTAQIVQTRKSLGDWK